VTEKTPRLRWMEEVELDLEKGCCAVEEERKKKERKMCKKSAVNTHSRVA
jgi:hypothetical protein